MLEEIKTYYPNGQLREHCFFYDSEREGEYKSWNASGQLHEHCFFHDGKDITEEAMKYIDNDVMFALAVGVPRL